MSGPCLLHASSKTWLCHGFEHFMPTAQHVQRYRTLTTGQEVLESALRSEFSEYLNAEVVLRTIVDVYSAVAWLKSTYLYIRVRALGA